MRNFEFLKELDLQERVERLAQMGFADTDAVLVAQFIDIYPPCSGLCPWKGNVEVDECEDFNKGNCVLCRGLFRWLREPYEENPESLPLIDKRVLSKITEQTVLRFVH